MKNSIFSCKLWRYQDLWIFKMIMHKYSIWGKKTSKNDSQCQIFKTDNKKIFLAVLRSKTGQKLVKKMENSQILPRGPLSLTLMAIFVFNRQYKSRKVVLEKFHIPYISVICRECLFIGRGRKLHISRTLDLIPNFLSSVDKVADKYVKNIPWTTPRAP